ncbi:hypothetical protein [Clavibacter zhangzhiyongii]|uniref:hypothetical protein n=1 Tax=Clavibacter zhangzhiyongii TaxID=2768071 RepID=UPI0039E09123
MTAPAAETRRATAGGPDGSGRATGGRLVASGLLAASALLQLDASLQRWVTARDALPPSRRDSIESHEHDHDAPTAGWIPLGDAAERHGAGMILLALAVVALAVAVGARGRSSAVLVLAVAGSFAVLGLHALLSGIAGAPSPLGGLLLPAHLVGLAGLVGIAALRAGRPRARPLDAVALALVAAASLPGQLLAAFVVAPMLHGDTSYDTTPWTETVVAVAIGLAAVATAAGGVRAALPAAGDPVPHLPDPARRGARGAADPLPLGDEH